MSAQCEVTAKRAAGSSMSMFERYLTVWVGLCIVVGIALGHWFPTPFQSIGQLEVAQVNLPVAVLIWLMIIPMLLKVDFGALHQVNEHWRGIGVTRYLSTGRSSLSRWRCSVGFLSVLSLLHTSPRINLMPTLRV